MMRIRQWVALAAASLLVACGGGGGSGGDNAFGGGGGSGSGSGSTPVASDLLVTLSASSITNSGSESVSVQVTAVDASRNAVANVPVTISVDSNAVLVPAGTATGDTGVVTGTVTIGADRSNRTITVRAVSGSIERSASFLVTGARILATLVPATMAPGATGNEVQYRLVDVNSNPMSNLPITVVLNGTSVSGVTGANGDYRFPYTAPTAVGAYTITAAAAGATDVSTITVQGATGTVPNVPVGAVQSASVSANPSVVSVNTGSTSNRAELRALFLGANNAPVPNVRVRFDDNGDPNSIGGSFTTGTTVIYSNESGIASSAYVPGTRSSPTNGVTVRACYWLTDDTSVAPVGCATSTLTVVSEPLAVSLGFTNEVGSSAGGLTYTRDFIVQVVDARGGAKSDVEIVPSVDLERYFKGYYTRPVSATAWGPVLTATCNNEDTNRNGVNETGEDIDADGQLEPRKSDVAIYVVGSSKTNSSGQVTLRVEYPKNIATWVEYRVLVSAVGIAGTEGRTSRLEVARALRSDVDSVNAPPFVTSPYGIAGSCTDPN